MTGQYVIFIKAAAIIADFHIAQKQHRVAFIRDIDMRSTPRDDIFLSLEFIRIHIDIAARHVDIAQ